MSDEWRGIETAPQNGDWVWLVERDVSPPTIVIGSWSSDLGWVGHYGRSYKGGPLNSEPTHWKSLRRPYPVPDL